MILTFVFVSQRTSNCCNRSVTWPASLLPRNQGTQWHPGSSTSSYFPNFSLTATVDWPTCTQQNRLPISNFWYCSLERRRRSKNSCITDTKKGIKKWIHISALHKIFDYCWHDTLTGYVNFLKTRDPFVFLLTLGSKPFKILYCWSNTHLSIVAYVI